MIRPILTLLAAEEPDLPRAAPEVEAGAHEIAVDYQQFGGSMALNIQRALEGQPPAPEFLQKQLQRPRRRPAR